MSGKFQKVSFPDFKSTLSSPCSLTSELRDAKTRVKPNQNGKKGANVMTAEAESTEPLFAQTTEGESLFVGQTRPTHFIVCHIWSQQQAYWRPHTRFRSSWSERTDQTHPRPGAASGASVLFLNWVTRARSGGPISGSWRALGAIDLCLQGQQGVDGLEDQQGVTEHVIRVLVEGLVIVLREPLAEDMQGVQGWLDSVCKRFEGGVQTCCQWARVRWQCQVQCRLRRQIWENGPFCQPHCVACRGLQGEQRGDMVAASTLLEDLGCCSSYGLQGLNPLIHHRFHVSIENADRGCEVRYAGGVHCSGERSKWQGWQLVGTRFGGAKSRAEPNLGGNGNGVGLKNLVP